MKKALLITALLLTCTLASYAQPPFFGADLGVSINRGEGMGFEMKNRFVTLRIGYIFSEKRK